jgi:ribonucleotide reductase beta subunit family protein with ferritin-like domain
MAIFTAGCIESTNSSKKIRDSVYELAKYDLDSPAMKISVRKSSTCINFIAFLPKDKIKQENILKKVSETQEKSVIIFELDYKHVGVVCEYGRIIDYILDKPKEFAIERNYENYFVDNANGVDLVFFNLDENSRRTKAGFVSLGFTILLTSAIFYSGFYYMQGTNVNRGNKESLEQEYKTIVRDEFEKSEKIVQKVDLVNILEDIERLTKTTGATLKQIKYSEKNICVEVQTIQIEPFLSLLPPNSSIKKSDKIDGIVSYCYEAI